jgi:hypothetical protein
VVKGSSFVSSCILRLGCIEFVFHLGFEELLTFLELF